MNELKQSALLEREVSDLQQSSDSVLADFSRVLNHALDNSLIEVMNITRKVEMVKNDSASQLNEMCVAVVESLFKRYPPEMMTAAKLFLNRPLPTYLRKRIWSMNLSVDSVELAKVPSRLAPLTDVIISRRILMLLERHLPSFSSRTNAVAVKSIISNFMRFHSLPLPNNEENFALIDTLFFVLVPILLTFSNLDYGYDFIYGTIEKEYCGKLDDINHIRLSERALNSVASSRQLGLLNDSGGFTLKSSSLEFTNVLLEQKNEDLARKLSSLYGGPGNNYSTAVFGSLDGDNQFEDAIDGCLRRGLSGLLPLETVLYVWDQGIVGKFDIMLPIVCSALLLGAGDEIMSVTQFSVALDIFQSYCCAITVDSLQKLITKYCSHELNEISENQGSLVFTITEEGVLRAIYPKLFPARLHETHIHSVDSSKSLLSDTEESYCSKTEVEERVRRETGLALRSI